MTVFLVNGIKVRVWPRHPFPDVVKICTEDHARALKVQKYLDDEQIITGGLGLFYDK